MGKTTRTRLLVALTLCATAALWLVAVAAAGNSTRVIVSSGATAVPTDAAGSDASDGIQAPELDTSLVAADGGPIVNRTRPGFKNGKFPKNPLDTPVVDGSAVGAPGSELAASFDGLNFRGQRRARAGNQFSVEPPDQALCVGNGKVIEAVNDVIQIYSSSGAPQVNGGADGPNTLPVDLNTFYGYPAAINRSTGARGPILTDPVCLYDAGIDRFVVVVLTLDRIGTSNPLAGTNHLDIAVSPNGSPTTLSGWTIYKVDVTDDGTNGTPNHGCTSTAPVPHPNAALGDFPHIGADANGVYITTNEYCLFGDGFNGAQIYVVPKADIAAGGLSIRVLQVENTVVDGSPGFTVWPSNSPAGGSSTENGGTEFFLSTIAGDGSETGNPTGTARRIGLWSISNTSSLNTASPSIVVASRLINSETYVVPPTSDQKPGSIPLGDCLNDTTLSTPFGPGCWQFFFFPPQPPAQVESTPDSSDTRIEGVWFVNGMLWGAADTGVVVGGKTKAGIAWFAVKPKVNGDGKVEGSVKKQGYVAVAGNNVSYPAIAVLPSGKGVMAFTLMGETNFPSAAYALIDASEGTVGSVRVAAAGAGPDDGFTSYKSAFGTSRTRWGDYGAAATDGSSIWIASEYIGQTCTLAQFVSTSGPSAPRFSCGRTRDALGNWNTRVSKITP